MLGEKNNPLAVEHIGLALLAIRGLEFEHLKNLRNVPAVHIPFGIANS